MQTADDNFDRLLRLVPIAKVDGKIHFFPDEPTHVRIELLSLASYFDYDSNKDGVSHEANRMAGVMREVYKKGMAQQHEDLRTFIGV